MSAMCTPRRTFAAAATIAAAFCASTTLAQAPNFSMVWDASGDSVDPFTYNPGEFGEANDIGGGVWQYTGGIVGDGWEIMWDCIADDNRAAGAGGGDGTASVDAEIVVVNTSDTDQTFSMLMSLDLAEAFLGSTSSTGSAGYTVTNNSFTGEATIAAPGGGSIYSSYLDLVDPFSDPALATLFDDPFSDNIAGAFASSSGSDSFGSVAGPAVNDNIAILLTFTLSAGDSASVSGILTVVPGPGAFALLAVGGLVGTRRRRG